MKPHNCQKNILTTSRAAYCRICGNSFDFIDFVNISDFCQKYHSNPVSFFEINFSQTKKMYYWKGHRMRLLFDRFWS